MSNPSGSATELYSSTINIETANSTHKSLFCNVVNVSTSARSGTLQILALDGSSLAAASYNNVQPGVGTGISVSVFQGSVPMTVVYCKITVDAGAEAIRGSLSLSDSNGNTVVSVEAR
jgi:hypothetical protein